MSDVWLPDPDRRVVYDVQGHDGPAAVLVHGMRAHRGWWHLVLPRLAGLRVVTLDLSGHGDASRARPYRIEGWAREVLGVMDAAGLDAGVLVGHSLGGHVAAAAASSAPERVLGVLTIDTMVADVSAIDPGMIPVPRPPKRHATQEDAIAAFRLDPRQPLDEEALSPVARAAIHQVDGGWTVRTDPHVVDVIPTADLTGWLADCPRPLRWAHGAHSALMTDRMLTHARSVLSRAEIVEIPDAHHHVPLDSPVACADLIRDAVAGWDA